MMKTVKIKRQYWDIAADIHFPPDFDERKNTRRSSAPTRSAAAEQTSGNVYGAALAKAGFVVIAFDASFRARAAANRALSKIPLSAWKIFAS